MSRGLVLPPSKKSSRLWQRRRRVWLDLLSVFSLTLVLAGCGAGSAFLPPNLPGPGGGGFALRILTTDLVDGIAGRTYTNTIETAGGRPPISTCTVQVGSLPSGLTLTPDGTTCTLSGTISGAAAGTFNFTLLAVDSSGRTATQAYTFVVRAEFDITAFQVVDAIANRSYSKTFVVFTNLSNDPDPDELGSAAEAGNGPITACEVVSAGLPAGMTGTCAPAADGVSMEVQLTAPDATLVPGGPFPFTLRVSDTDILQSGNIVVPLATTLTNATQPNPFVVSISVRNDLDAADLLTPVSLDTVDAIQGRAYNRTFTFTTALEDNGDDVPNDVGTGEDGNGPISACVVSGLPGDFTVACALNPDGVSGTITISTPTVVTSAPAANIPLTLELFDSPIPQASPLQVGPVVPASSVTLDFVGGLTIREEFSITEPLLVDAVEGRDYTKTIDTTLEDADLGDFGSVEIGNGPAAVCAETTGNLAAIGLSIDPDPSDPSNCLISGTVTSGGGTTVNITIAVTDEDINQAPQGTPVVGAATLTRDYTLVVRAETTFSNTTVVDAVTGRSYTHSIVTDRDLPNPTGGDGPITCALTGSPPSGLDIQVAANGLDCELFTPTVITDAAGPYNFSVDVTDADILQDASTVVAGATVSQAYTLRVRDEFDFLTAAVVDGVAGRAYSKLVETNLVDVAGADDIDEIEFGNGPVAANACGVSTSALGPFTSNIVVAVAGGDITLAVEPDATLPAPSSCRLTATIPSTIAGGEFVEFFIQATDNVIPFTNPRTAGVETVVPAQPIVSGMLTLTVRDDTGIDLAASNCTVAGVCPAAVKDRTYTNALVQIGGTGGDPPVQWNVTAGAFTLSAGVWTGTAGTACEALTIDQASGAVDGTPTGATAGNCAFTITLADAGIKQATQADHGATLAGTMLEVVPTGSDSEALSIDVRLEMTIANTSLPGGLKSSTYNATLSAINGLTTAGEVGLPAVLTWSEPSGLLGTGACAGLALVDPDATSANNTATIEGTPTTAGTCGPLTLRADDDGNAPGTGNFVPAGFAETTLSIVINDSLGFVTNFTGSNVRVIDTDANAATANTVASTGGATPTGIALNPKDPLFGYVANGPTGDVQVFCTRVDAAAGCPVAFTGLGGVPTSIAFPGGSVDPRDVAILPTGDFGLVLDRAFAFCPPGGGVFVFDTTTHTFTGGFDCNFVATFAESIAVRPQGDRAYVTTGNDTLVEFTLFGPGLAISNVIPIPVGGTTTLDVAISPDGRFAYVTDSTNSRVHVIDVSTPAAAYVASTPAPGSAGGLQAGAVLQFIAFAPDGRYAYVTDIGNDVVAAIDPATLGGGTVAVTQNNIALATGLDPFGLALTDNVLKAFVANNGTASVSVIDTDATPSATFQTELTSFDGAANFSGPYGVATMPNPSLHIVNPLPAGIEGRAYDSSVIAVGGTRPYTFSVDPLDLPPGLAMDANGRIAGIPSTGSGSPAGTTYPFDVTVVDSSNPTQSHTRTLSITIFDTSALAVGTPTDAIKGRTYTFNLDSSGGALPVFWSDGGTLAGDADCAGLSLAANGVLSGTPSLAPASGTCGFTATANDASGPVASFPITLVIRAEFSTTAFAVVDAIAGRAYSNSLVVTTNLSNSATEVGQTGEFGNGPITACSVLDLLAIGVTATCTPGISGTDMMISLSAPTATLVAPGTTFRIQVTDSPIDTAVPANTLDNTTQPSPFLVSLTVRDEFTVGPIIDPVDAVEGRTYTNSVTIPSDLENNPAPSEVGSAENGNGPVTGCVVLDGATALTNFNGTTTGSTVRGLTVTCTGFSFGASSAVVNFSGTASTGTQETKVLTVRLFDTVIQQNASTVVDIPGNAGNALVSATFNLTFRDEFTITSTPPTQANVPDAVDGDVYSFTFTVDTDLSNIVSNVGQVAENGNGPILAPPGVTGGTGCEVTGLPTGFQYGYTLMVGGAGGAQADTKCEITISAVTTVPTAAIGTHALSVTVRDTTIGAVVPSGAVQQAQFNLVVTAAALTFTVSAVNSGALTACSLGTLTDPGSGGTLPTTADAVLNRTYGPGRCDLLFSVSGGKKPFNWAITNDALGGMTCTVVNFPTNGDTGRGFRCQRSTAVPVGLTPDSPGLDTFTVKACDSNTTAASSADCLALAAGGGLFASTSRIITVRDQLSVNVAPDPVPDAVSGRPYGNPGGGIDLVYTIPAAAGIGIITMTGTGFPTGIDCDQTLQRELRCDTDANDNDVLNAGEVVSGGTATGTVTTVDTANLTTPAATTVSDPSRIRMDTVTVNNELTVSNPFLQNGTKGEPYRQLLVSNLGGTGNPDNASAVYTWSVSGGGVPGVDFVVPATEEDPAIGYFQGTPSTASTTAAEHAVTFRVEDDGNATTPSCAAVPAPINETCPDTAFTVNVLRNFGYVATFAAPAPTEQGTTVVAFDATGALFTAQLTISMDTDGALAENPLDVKLSPDGRFAYVTKQGDTNDVSVIDTITTVTGGASADLARDSIPTDPGTFNPSYVALRPQQFNAVTPFVRYDAWVLNPETGDEANANVQPLSPGHTPASAAAGTTTTVANANRIAIHPDGTRAYVTSEDATTNFRALDVTTTPATVAAMLDLGDFARVVLADPRGHLVYARRRVAATSNDNIAVIRTSDNTEVATIGGADLCTTGGPNGLATSPDARRLYVQCGGDDTLLVFDISPGSPAAAAFGTQIGTAIPLTGCSVPQDIKVNAAGTKAFVSCLNTDNVVVISTNTTTDTYTVEATTIPTDLQTGGSCGTVDGSCPELMDTMVNPPLHITTGGNASGSPSDSTVSLPNAAVATFYSTFVVATGGTLPRTWMDASRSTPTSFAPVLGVATTPCEGLTLDTTTGEISGTPVNSGTCGPFIIRVTDASTPGQYVERKFQIIIP